MTTQAMKREDVEVFQVTIKATPQAIWDAITSPDWNGRYIACDSLFTVMQEIYV